MKKLTYVIAAMVLLAIFVACEKNELITSQSSQQNQLEAVVNNEFGMLVFDNKKALLNQIQNPQITRSTNNQFISLLNLRHGLRSSNSEDSLTYYDALGYDNLVPNENFARLLNPNGEIQVNDTIYRINRNGTYYYHKHNASEFEKAFIKDSIGAKIEENLYLIADGIYRYDTFKETLESEEVYLEDMSADETRSTMSDPNYESFPKFNADRHTWFGKLWQGVFGNDKSYTVNLNDKRRLHGRLYGYHYVVYSEIGIGAKFQKKNWIGWSKTVSDELRINWKNIALKYKIKELGNIQRPNISQPVMSNLHSVRLTTNTGEITWLKNTVTMIVPSMTDTEFYTYLAMAIKHGNNELKKQLAPPTADQKLHAVTISDLNTVTVVILNDENRVFNESSMTKVFYTGVNFMISTNPMGSISNLINWGKTIQYTLEQSKPELYSGEAVICARLDGKWVGMRIVK